MQPYVILLSKPDANLSVEFDKRTNLGVSSNFPRLIQSDLIMSGHMAKDVCAQLNQDLVKIVPQVDDFLCPICFGIVWRPIKMRCKHVICIRCTILLQRQKKRFCPLCRENVILEADTGKLKSLSSLSPLYAY